MRRQTIALLLAGFILFGVGIGVALGVIGNEEPSRRAPTGRTTMVTTTGGMAPGMTMPGMTMPAETAHSAQTQARRASRLLSPARFASAVADGRTVTINVHVPREGSIAGTDLWIPYDRIEQSRQLPASRSTRLAVYCRSGRMSAIAVRALARLGYRRVVELRGGMEAWVASGRRLVQ